MEYRICWSATSNISFHGSTDWEPWGGDETTDGEIQDSLVAGSTQLSEGLGIAIEASGFEWWVETRKST